MSKLPVKQNKSIFALLVLIMFVFFQYFVYSSPIYASGVSLDVTSPTDGEFDASTDTDVTFDYTPSSTEFGIGDIITIVISPSVVSAVDDCASATDDLDQDTTTDGSFGSFTTSGAVYTVSAATTQATGTDAEMCLNFQNDTVAGIYSISFYDDNDNDYGSALIYVGDDNDVTVTGEVQPTLSFAIRNSTDTSDTNACDLGVLDISSVSTCEYRLKPATNASSGYTVQIDSDGDLRRSGSGDVADSEDIDPVTENNTVGAGTEDYGIAFNGGSATGGNITESGDFNDDDTPIPISSKTNLYTSDGPNSPSSPDTTNTALVTHRAAIDNSTNTGNYSHTISYYASASF